MKRARTSPRGGVSLIEALVAVAILAVSVTAMMSLSSQQPRAVALDEARQLATMVLQELQSAFGNQPYAAMTNRGFLPPPASDGAASPNAGLLHLLFEDHPLITLPGIPEEAPAAQRVLAKRIQAADIRRAIYIQDIESVGSRRRVRVTFRVYYEIRGQDRFVEAHEVVTER